MAEPIPSDKESRARSIRELLFVVNETIHTRTSFLLVTESILVAGYFAIEGEGGACIAQVGLSAFALVLTFLLWRTGASLERRSVWLAKDLRPIDEVYDGYMNASTIGATKQLVHSVPFAFGVGWLLLGARSVAA